MKNLALLILSGLLPYFLSAQQGAVKGNLSDSTFQPLSNATISVLQKKDSSLVGYTMSDSKGIFGLKNLPSAIINYSYHSPVTKFIKELFPFPLLQGLQILEQ